MALGEPIKIRLSPENQAIYKDKAARLNKPLATYLRERLEANDSDRAELDAFRHELAIGLSAIRKAVEDNGGGPEAKPSTTAAREDRALLPSEATT